MCQSKTNYKFTQSKSLYVYFSNWSQGQIRDGACLSSASTNLTVVLGGDYMANFSPVDPGGGGVL